MCSARSRTVSPSRSYVVDASVTSFSALYEEENEDTSRSGLPSSTSDGSTLNTLSSATAGGADEEERGRSRRPDIGTQSTPIMRLAQRWKAHVAAGRFVCAIEPSTPLGAEVAGGEGFWCSHHVRQVAWLEAEA